jgi:VCBS repeat-containing protein
VNDAPVAVNDGTYNATEDTALVVASAQGVLVNDTDIDSSSLTAALVAGPSHGDVTLNSNGSFTYTPASNYSGTDSFTYRASDGSLTSDIATVSISVGAVNDAPTANADIKTTPRNIALTFPAGDLLANDSDAEGSALSLTAVGNAVSGTVVLNGGQITFTPAANFTGNASFKYTVCDVQSACSQGNVTVNVTQAYSFGAISFPSSGNQGSVLPLVWSYSLNNQPVNTSSLVPQVRVRALTSCQNGTETGDFVVNTKTPGNSDFQYSTTTNQWKYNWQTKLFAANTCYNVYIRLLAADGVTILQEDGPFKIQLKASK